MSSIQLLDKTRKINKLLHNNNSQKVVFNDICKVLTEVMNSNVLVISKKGKILGKNEADHIEVLHQLISGNVKDYVDFSLNERLFPPMKMSAFPHWDLSQTLMITMRSSHRSISQERDSEHYLCTAREKIIPLMILS